MAIDPEELLPIKKVTGISVGQDISALSEFELEARIAALKAEIVRVESALVSRKATRSAADAFFKS